ncbi:hypothetical protein R1flu_002567 [Riccia fluitans]|uniref:Uncharacterized protein n=1 Tax=Riccia fluitans TaxID=41844 RepID=A0ABD1Y6G3_9MARC
MVESTWSRNVLFKCLRNMKDNSSTFRRSRLRPAGPAENDSLENPVGAMSACRLDQRFHLENEGWENKQHSNLICSEDIRNIPVNTCSDQSLRSFQSVLHASERRLQRPFRHEDTFRWLLLSRNCGGGSRLMDLETSLASLYESMEEKIKATSYISNLTRQTEWLATIAKHTSVSGALARVLREEGRKSFSLRFNIVSTFFMMSFFPKFHQVLLEQKVGKTTLHILILEVQCMETRMQSSKLEETAAIPPRLNTGDSTSGLEISLMFQTAKQEKLLYMSISLLLNIAEDLSVEKRMEKFNLVEYLCKLLVRKSFALLSITVTFLKKLSIFKQNMDAMKENGIIYRLSVLIPCQHESLLLPVLRLLWNLSFDLGLRVDMVKCKVIQALEMLLKENKFEHLVFGLLYHLSMDGEGRLEFLETDIVPLLLQIMTTEPRERTTGELLALAVNLTLLPQNCEIICRSQGLERLILRAIQFNDPLLFKVIKNISKIETGKPQIIRFLPALVEVVRRPDSCIFLQMEVMTIFNNVTSVGNIFNQLLEDTFLLQFFSDQLKTSLIEDDLFLQIILYVGSICSERIAANIAESGLLLWTVGQFLLYESTRNEVVACDKDSKKAVARLAEILMNTIVEFDAQWCAKVKWLKFASYNMKRFSLSEDKDIRLSSKD